MNALPIPEKLPHVLVCGGRDFDLKDVLWRKLDELTVGVGKVVVVTGACRTGADRMGEDWAFAHSHTVLRFHADWEEHGKSAGPRRNAEMVGWFAALPVSVKRVAVAAWDGDSAGTGDCVARLKKFGIPIRYVWY